MPMETISNLTRAKDYSSEGNHGNIVGAVCNSTNGLIGSGCVFDGNCGFRILYLGFEKERPGNF